MLCKHNIYLSSKTFSPLQKEASYLLSHQSHHPLSLPLVTTNLLSVSMDWLILDGSYKWTHTLYSLFGLTSFTKHNAFEVHPCCSMYNSVIPFSGWILFYCIYIPQLFMHSSVDRHLGCFHLVALVNSAIMSTHLPQTTYNINDYGPSTQFMARTLTNTFGISWLSSRAGFNQSHYLAI